MTLTDNHDAVRDMVVREAGDVPNSALGVGYDADELDREAELDELAEAEVGAAPLAASDPDDEMLPDELGLHATGAEAGAPAAAAPSLAAKVLRTFVFAGVGTLVTALLPILDGIASGGGVDLSLLGALAIAAITGAIAAGVRAAVAYLPVFGDDDVGRRR